MAGFLGEDRQDGGTDVAPLHAPAATATFPAFGMAMTTVASALFTKISHGFAPSTADTPTTALADTF
ncbi:MAG: hypothetical protein M3Q30_15420 [Actinomycetota bacterium]|nr:hypothetical protein [Actinomycetota bacterium]